MLAEEAGFDITTFETGEAALESLTKAGAHLPDVVLADMQMPGISGESFARLLRSACGTGTTLLAMSGTSVPAERTSAFDGFLLKPFSMKDVLAAVDHVAAPPAVVSATTEYSDVLNRAIYDSFAQSMPAQQLRQLYDMSLDDADARIEVMRNALASNDPDAYRRAAHSIKGGCGMVGAVELARMASDMEELGPRAIDDIDPLQQFLSASIRLRRILNALSK